MDRIGVIGSATMDRNVQGTQTSIKMGGVVTYAGLTFRRHGLATTVVTNVAPTDARLIDLLRKLGVECVNGETETTTRFVNRLEGAPRRQEMPTHASPIMAKQALAVLNRVDHIHLGPLHPDDLDRDLYALIGKSRATISLDLQGCVRRVVNGLVETAASAILPDSLRCADYVKADPVELDVTLKALDMDVVALMDEFALREIVVTEGSKGGYVVEQQGITTPYTAVPVPQITDPTGAGDVFIAAYLVSRLHERRPVAEAGAYAAEVAARQVAGKYIPETVLRLDTASL